MKQSDYKPPTPRDHTHGVQGETHQDHSQLPGLLKMVNGPHGQNKKIGTPVLHKTVDTDHDGR